MFWTISLNILFLALGFFLLAKGADLFVDGSSSVARRFKIPQLVIGLTVVAMGTSMPEAAVSIKAAISPQSLPASESFPMSQLFA